MIRVLVLTRYDRSGASSRLRTFQYLREFDAAEFDFTVHSLLGAKYLERLYQRDRVPLIAVLNSYLSRLMRLLRSRRFDVVWIEKEALPWLPAFFERLSVPVVLDYDDALFHRYDQHPNRLVRKLLGRKIDRLMSRANVVIAGNRYIEEHAYGVGAQKVVRIPTCVDIEKYQPALSYAGDPFTIGWIGTPETAKFLFLIAGPLKALAETGRVAFRFIGAPADLPLNFAYTSVEWSEDTEADELAKLDCGIMPLPDQPFERGKSGYKLIQYMACSLPVVASPVGANCDIVDDGRNGVLAETDEQWLDALSLLMSDSELRAQFGIAGRRLIEREFDHRRAVVRLSMVLKEAGRQ